MGNPQILARENMEQKTEEFLWVDWMRVLATFGVVFLHTASPLLSMYHNVPDSYWWIANIYDSMVRMSVPLFFMISGFLLLPKQYSLLTFFSKRVHKVLIPLLAWSIFFLLWKAYYEHSISLSLDSFLSLISAPAYFHLWFFYALLGLYLAVPVLRVIAQHAEPTILQYFVALWFIGASLIPLVEKFSGIQIGINLNFLLGYGGFFILGYLLGTHPVTKTHARIACVTACTCVMITAVGTYFLMIANDGLHNGYLYRPLAPNVIVLAGSTFVLVRFVVEHYPFVKHETVHMIIRSLSTASLGIYLIHVIILNLLRHGHLGIYLYGYRGNPAIHIPITALATFCLSYAMISILRMNHLTRKLVP